MERATDDSLAEDDVEVLVHYDFTPVFWEVLVIRFFTYKYIESHSIVCSYR